MSHFVLRLAHCRGEELRKWFQAQEGELFAARFREEPGKVGQERLTTQRLRAPVYSRCHY